MDVIFVSVRWRFGLFTLDSMAIISQTAQEVLAHFRNSVIVLYVLQVALSLRNKKKSLFLFAVSAWKFFDDVLNSLTK